MTLDPYQLCPCGSGKKVKFCCSRDIAHELERVERMIQGEQRLAALEKLDSLLVKYPDRPSLLMLKAEVELALKEWPKAESTIERLLQVDPRNPSVQALPAILQGIRGQDIHLAVEQLQHAFAVADSCVTARMYEAIMMLSVRLLRQGYPAAAKGHLQLALALSDAKDERCTSLLMQLNQSRSIPLLLREPLDLMPCPDNVTWSIEFQAAMAEVYRGRWLSGAQKLADMSKRILDAVPILQNLAVLCTWLAQNREAVQAFRALSRIRDLPLDDRVHAEALAQLLDQESDAQQIDMLQLTFELADIEPLMEQCLSSKKLRQLAVDAAASEGEEPPPKAVFDVLDRPMPPTGQAPAGDRRSPVDRHAGRLWPADGSRTPHRGAGGQDVRPGRATAVLARVGGRRLGRTGQRAGPGQDTPFDGRSVWRLADAGRYRSTTSPAVVARVASAECAAALAARSDPPAAGKNPAGGGS